MKVNVCDACKEVYKPYTSNYHPEDNSYSVNANGITLIRTDREGKLHGKGKLELCPSCLQKTIQFIFTDLVVDDDAPFMEKLRYYETKRRERGSERED